MPEEQKSPPTEAHLEALNLRQWKSRSEADNSERAEEDAPESQEATAETGNGQSESTLTLSAQGIQTHKWRRLRQNVADCTQCELHRTRTNAVFGVGKEDTDLMLIGEAPGADEDAKGEPFVGRAGLLLNNMLLAVGLRREDVFITNILKCRPPNNENPTSEQAMECSGHLKAQIEMIQPRIILALGSIAAKNLLDVDTTIGKLRGRVHELPGTNIPIVPTYHPAYLLRSPKQKAESFKDLLLLVETMKGLIGEPAAQPPSDDTLV